MGMYLYVLFYSTPMLRVFAGFDSSLEGVRSKKTEDKLCVCVCVWLCAVSTPISVLFASFVDLRRGGEEQRFAWRSSQFAYGFYLSQL